MLEPHHKSEKKLKNFSTPRAVQFSICTQLGSLCGDAANSEGLGKRGPGVAEIMQKMSKKTSEALLTDIDVRTFYTKNDAQ